MNSEAVCLRNLFEHVARVAVKYGFVTWNPDFDEDERSSKMTSWDQSKLDRVFTFDEAKRLLE